MNKTLEYNGYLGTVEYNNKDKCWYGKIIGIDDLVSYESKSVEDLNRCFKESIEDYLSMCKEINKKPNSI